MTVTALEYHDVVAGERWDESGFPGTAAASYKLSVDNFVGHLDALAAHPCPVGISAQRALNTTTDSVLFTFDDGGASASTIGSLLTERGWTAHIFVTTDRIGATGFLDKQAIRSLHNAGHVIGSHSASHPARMSRLTRDAIELEWQKSISALGDLVGAPIRVASVPGGHVSPAVIETAAAAGIEVLFTSEPTTRIYRVESCAVVGRFTLRTAHRADYVKGLVSAWPARRVMQWAAWNTRKVGKRLGGEVYLRLREAYFNRSLR